MHDFFAPKHSSRSTVFEVSERHSLLYAALILLLFLAVLVGALLGLFALDSSLDFPSLRIEILSSTGSISKELLWEAAPILAVSLCACAYPGFIAVPLIFMFRAFAFSYAVSALYASTGYAGLLEAVFRFGVPALLTIPVLVLASAESIRRSVHLMKLRFSSHTLPLLSSDGGRAFPAIFLALVIDLIYLRCALQPILRILSR